MTITPKCSFEFDGRPPRMGVPVVNGYRIESAETIDVHVAAQEIPTVTLKLMAADALRLLLDDARFVIKVHDETREALISLGWTPPADEPGGRLFPLR